MGVASENFEVTNDHVIYLSTGDLRKCFVTKTNSKGVHRDKHTRMHGIS